MERRQRSLRIHSVKDLGQAIREKRKREGLTLAEAAGLTGVGIRFLSELENGKPKVRLDKLLQVLSAFGLQLDLTTADVLGARVRE